MSGCTTGMIAAYTITMTSTLSDGNSYSDSWTFTVAACVTTAYTNPGDLTDYTYKLGEGSYS